jgi:hypothetical protein
MNDLAHPTNNRRLEDMAAEWLAHKASEDAAKAARLAVETEMCAALPIKPEGATTFGGPKSEIKIDGFKIEAEGILNRKIDLKQFDAIVDKIPEELRGVVKVKREADPTGVKFIEQNHPDVYRTLCANGLTVTPGKTAFKVTRVEAPAKK